MSFELPPHSVETDPLFAASLPGLACTACGHWIPRRVHRVWVRATWREARDNLCMRCWQTVCDWAARFALIQDELPLGGIGDDRNGGAAPQR